MRPETRILYSLCDRITGLGARSAPKDAGLTSRGPLPGPGSPTRVFGALGWKISRGGAPRLVRPSVGPHLKMRPLEFLHLSLSVNNILTDRRDRGTLCASLAQEGCHARRGSQGCASGRL